MDLSDLRKPFPKSQIEQIPKGGAKLDYVSHANVTARLLDVDPEWTWEPVAFDELGTPLIGKDLNGHPTLWIRLTVCGVTRLGVGTCDPKAFEPSKELIGDAIRNAAMRFGVALDLWAKTPTQTPQRKTRAPKSEPAPSSLDESTLADLHARIDSLKAWNGEATKAMWVESGLPKIDALTADDLEGAYSVIRALEFQRESEGE